MFKFIWLFYLQNYLDHDVGVKMSNVNLTALIKKLNPICQRALEAAAGMCLSRSHYNVEIEHWLLKLLESTDNDLVFILRHYDVEIGKLINDLTSQLDRLKTGNAQAPALSQRVIDLTKEAFLLGTLDYSADKIRSAYLLYGLLHEENLKQIIPAISPQLTKISVSSLQQGMLHLIANSNENKFATNMATTQQDQKSSHVSSKTPALDQFTIDLTQLARQGKVDQVIGREFEIRQMIDILMRRRQNNPILTGEPGVGKTAVVEGLALRIGNGDVPPALQNVAIHTLDLGLLQAGAGIKGEFENRLKSILQEVKNSLHPIIVFIDEAHTLVGASAQASQADAANLLKPALARGELKTIAATTWAEYKKYFEQDAALARRFQVIKVDEPTEEIAITMLRGLVPSLEMHHHVRILDEAVIAAVRLSNRYLSERQLPDKAISVLDTACSRLALQVNTQPPILEDYQCCMEHLKIEKNIIERENINSVNHSKRLHELNNKYSTYQAKFNNLQSSWKKEIQLIHVIRTVRQELETLYISNHNDNNFKNITLLQKKLQKLNKSLQKLQSDKPLLQDCVNAQIIADVISNWTGIPVGRMVSDDIQYLLNLEARLQQRIFGQTHALKIIANSIQVARAQLADPRKPIGIFLLVGPSGVGKTETAHALAELLYGSIQNMITINLSEFKEEHKVSLLLGSPPGYVGYGEGGILTEAVRRKPYSLVLLDEVEKAHPGVQDIFYQVFDKGVLRDGQGRDVNFKNTIIILTSNVGSELISKLCYDPETLPDPATLTEAIRPELLKAFKPAFLGRATVVPYFALDETLMAQIIKLQLDKVQQRVFTHYQAKLVYEDSLISFIQEKCTNEVAGARNIEHLLQASLLPELSTNFLTTMAKNKKINTVHLSVNQEKIICNFN
jgi:type VI secretion system protein VasG